MTQGQNDPPTKAETTHHQIGRNDPGRNDPAETTRNLYAGL